MKIEIKSKDGEILFEYDKENNTIKDTVEKAVKENISLAKANLIGANLEGAFLAGADLKGADLRGTNLKYTYLEGADLRRANLKYTNLTGANLKGADLKGAYLSGANLERADLKEAYLLGAYLKKADLEGTNLKEADLRGVYLDFSDDSFDLEKIIKKFEEKTNIKILKTYINKNVLSPYNLIFWEQGVIIDEYEYIEPKKKMTLEQIKEELGYDFELIESEE